MTVASSLARRSTLPLIAASDALVSSRKTRSELRNNPRLVSWNAFP